MRRCKFGILWDMNLNWNVKFVVSFNSEPLGWYNCTSGLEMPWNGKRCTEPKASEGQHNKTIGYNSFKVKQQKQQKQQQQEEEQQQQQQAVNVTCYDILIKHIELIGLFPCTLQVYTLRGSSNDVSMAFSSSEFGSFLGSKLNKGDPLQIFLANPLPFRSRSVSKKTMLQRSRKRFFFCQKEDLVGGFNPNEIY